MAAKQITDSPILPKINNVSGKLIQSNQESK